MYTKSTYLVSFVLALSGVLTSTARAELVGWWRLDDGSGTVARDSSGKGNDGTLNGAPKWVAGHFGGALEFDGSDDYLDCGNDPSLDLTKWTISFWLNVKENKNYNGFVIKGLDASENYEVLGFADGSFHFPILHTDGSRTYVNTAAGVIVPGEWAHFAYSYDAAEGRRFYKNGSLIFGDTVSRTPRTSTASLTIGNEQPMSRYVNGIMDDVRIYNHVQTEPEILAAMEGNRGYPYALGPNPMDGALHADTWVTLSWRPGDFAVSHDVYLGESFDDVNAGTGDTFRGNQTSSSYLAGFTGYAYPDGLVPGTTYYWRIDEVNQADPNSPWKGRIWSFSVPPKKAYRPGPPDGAEYAALDVTLSWTAGLNAKLHYVYFGDNSDTVNNATGGAPRAAATYTPTAPLAKGKTYYWRVDEFDAAATHKGDVWSFTTLPDIQITNPDLIGWWKFDEGYGKKAIDFSGHGNDGTLGGDPQWVEGVLDGALDLTGDYVAIDGVVNDITSTNITLSAWIKTTQSSEGELFAANDSASAHPLMFGIDGGSPYVNDGSDTQFPPAVNDGQWHMITYVRSGSIGYIYVDGVQIGTYAATFALSTVTRWSIGQEWDTATPSDFYTGAVDDVRIYNKALTADEVKQLTRGDLLRAWNPSPNNRSTVDVERARQPLTWSPGDKASQHDLYFGLDKTAVGNAGASDTTGIYRGRQSARTYSPPEGLAWGTGPYYWRIDEVNNDGTITTGSIWSFSVADYLIVDDIESYNDLPETDPASNRIYTKWIDGYGTTTNGAMVGNLDVPLTQRSNVHGGGQAMPLSYDNNRKSSEATLTLKTGNDWTREGVANLSLWFSGLATNAAEKMYVALNGTAVVYNTDTTLTQKTSWTEWVIPLQQFAALGVNLSNVTSITIGFGTRGNTAVVGGTGQMYIDDIRLYRQSGVP